MVLYDGSYDIIPILNIDVVEDPSKCRQIPKYTVIRETHDQNSDADFMKESSLFGFTKYTRYLCYYKDEPFQSAHHFNGLDKNNFIVESIRVLGDKEAIPAGFSHLEMTSDTKQRVLKKKQLCYKITKVEGASHCISDIVLLAKQKTPPNGYTIAGDLNGLLLCFKLENVPKPYSLYDNKINAYSPVAYDPNSPPEVPYPSLYQDLLKGGVPQAAGGNTWPVRTSGGHNAFTNNANRPPADGDYISPPGSALHGVPFDINSRLKMASANDVDTRGMIPTIKTFYEIEKEYEYDFSAEHQALQRVPGSFDSN